MKDYDQLIHFRLSVDDRHCYHHGQYPLWASKGQHVYWLAS